MYVLALTLRGKLNKSNPKLKVHWSENYFISLRQIVYICQTQTNHTDEEELQSQDETQQGYNSIQQVDI